MADAEDNVVSELETVQTVGLVRHVYPPPPHPPPSSIIITQSKQSTSHLVLDHLQNCGNPARCRVACSDCHLSFVLQDIPVCPRRVFHDPSSTRRQARGSLTSFGLCMWPRRLREVGSHMLSQLNHGLMSTVAFRPV